MNEVKLAMVESLIKEENFSVEDLSNVPVISGLKRDFETLLGISKMMWERLSEIEGPQSASEWACSNIDRYWRDTIGILPYERYKQVEVTLTAKLIVPYYFDACDIIEEAINCDLGNEGSSDVVELKSQVLPDEVENIEHINTVDYEWR